MSLAPTLLDLCSGTGAWSRPFAESGWHVVRVDALDGADVRTLQYTNGPVDGILAAPPCTMFASSGARWERTDEQMIEALSVVDACLRQVALHHPRFWALENPIGKLSRWLGPPQHYFDPCEYGNPWTKRTALWGDFVMPMKENQVNPDPKLGPWWMGPSLDRASKRSETPSGFAQAFYEVNHA